MATQVCFSNHSFIRIFIASCNNTSCQVVVKIFDGAHKVEVLDDEPCEECSTKLLSAEFVAGKAPAALEGETKHVGCIFCDEVFAKLVSVKESGFHITFFNSESLVGSTKKYESKKV